MLEHMGAGVSEIIGTGGHDLLPQIGGITMRMGMDRLNRDDNTKVICLVSKLADETVMASILDDAETLDKPVVAVFLGGSETLFAGRRTQGAQSLEEAAELCYQQLTGEEIQVGWPDSDFRILVKEQLARITPERRYFRGLYCGGTFTEEALILFHRQNPQVPLYSNLSTSYAHKLLSHHQSTENTILDMGAEDFTAEGSTPGFRSRAAHPTAGAGACRSAGSGGAAGFHHRAGHEPQSHFALYSHHPQASGGGVYHRDLRCQGRSAKH